MELKVFEVTMFDSKFTAIGNSIGAVASCYVGAESIVEQSSACFIGNNSAGDQTLTKATQPSAAFTVTSGETTVNSASAIPSVEQMTITAGASLRIAGPSNMKAYGMYIDGVFYGNHQVDTYTLAPGVRVVSMKVVGCGGVSDEQYVKVKIS